MNFILIVTGSRAWTTSPTPQALAWARVQLTEAMLGYRSVPSYRGVIAAAVAHGDAEGTDTDAEMEAKYLGIPRVVFPLPLKGFTRGPELRTLDGTRPLRDAHLFEYGPPRDRNAVMMRWGASRRDVGDSVLVVSLQAPWSTSGGTENATSEAKKLFLPVIEPILPASTLRPGTPP